MDETDGDCQRAFERGNVEPHGENAVVEDHHDRDVAESERCNNENGDFEQYTSEETLETNRTADELMTKENGSEEYPEYIDIRVPLDDRHGPLVGDIQDAGVSVEQQFAQDREFMMGVEQRIHGLFQQLKYSDGGQQ